jgi:hypothetical protein
MPMLRLVSHSTRVNKLALCALGVAFTALSCRGTATPSAPRAAPRAHEVID